MKPKRVFAFAEDETFVVIQNKDKSIVSQGRPFELRAMLAAQAYSLIKNEIADPADIFTDLMTAVKFADAEKSGRLEELIAEAEEALFGGDA